jgi:hypothetical protein
MTAAGTERRRRWAPVLEFLRPRRAPSTVAPAFVSSGITVGTVLICCAVFGPKLGVIGLLGSMTTFWETGRPLWARVRNGLLVSFGVTASMAVGVVIAPLGIWVVPATVAIVIFVSILYHAFVLTAGPSPVMMFYAAVLGTFFGLQPGVGWSLVLVTATSSLITSVLLLLPLVARRFGPEERALFRADLAVARLERLSAGDCANRDEWRAARNTAYRAVTDAALTLRSAWPGTRRQHIAFTRTALHLQQRLIVASGPERPDADNLATPATLPQRPRARYLLRHALGSDSIEWFTTWRMAVGAGIAGAISESVGVGHPYWAILTATVVINQWTGKAAATQRAAHRALGTFIGVFIAIGISTAHPTPWTAVGIVLICAIGMYVTFPMHYALALACITPMALISVDAAAPGGALLPLATDRLVDTLIGAAVAVGIIWTTSAFFPKRLLRAQSLRAAAATTRVEAANRTGTPFDESGRHARAELLYELTHHLSVLDRAAANDSRLRASSAAEQSVADRGFRALNAAWAQSAESTEGGAVR